MGSLSAHGRNKALDALLGASHASTWPSTLYVAASTTDPATALTEPSGGSYARVAVTNDGTSFAASSTQQKSNAVAITFPTASAGWGTITHIALLDAATGGNLFAFDALGSAAVVLSGDVLTIPVGGLVVSV